MKNWTCKNACYFKWERPNNAHLYVIYSFAIFMVCECLKLYFNNNKENEIIAENVQALLCPILTGLPANSVSKSPGLNHYPVF